MQVGSLCSSVYLMYGPIVAAALTKFGRPLFIFSKISNKFQFSTIPTNLFRLPGCFDECRHSCLPRTHLLRFLSHLYLNSSLTILFDHLNPFQCNEAITPGAASSLTSLYFSYGLLLPAPLAAIHTGWIVAVQKQFPDSRGAATGLLMTGGGAGLFLLPPLLQWMIDTYGWRAAYCLLGAVSLNWTPAAATIFNTGLATGSCRHLKANRFVVPPI